MQSLEPIQTNIAYSPMLKRYTLAEFWELPEPDDRSHFELIEGVLHIVPPPTKQHGKIVAALNRSLMRFLIATNNNGNVYHPREAIFFENLWGTYLESDMMFVSEELERKTPDRRSSATIVFECISASSGIYDRTSKADTYLALGVEELWLIDPDTGTVEIRNRNFHNGGPVWQRRLYGANETAVSNVLADWSVALEDVFAG
ncbi:MAG: Uma2 family endonuclease [Acidobacteria bacterium]|nr:Uma2 family endonuclease [Acidobacteriota bacterium]